MPCVNIFKARLRFIESIRVEPENQVSWTTTRDETVISYLFHTQRVRMSEGNGRPLASKASSERRVTV